MSATYTPPRESKVIAVEVSDVLTDIGAEAAKRLPSGRRYRYLRHVTYKLENGESVAGTIGGLTKPKLAERIESTKNNISLGCMHATEYDFGEGPHWSLSVRLYIGPR